MAKRSRTDYIVIHCSATRPSDNITTEDIRRWHTTPNPDGNGWSDIGYHLVIERDGTAVAGRDIRRRGAHVRGHNNDSIGICLIGGVHETEMRGKWPAPQNNFTHAQFARLEDELFKLRKVYPDAKILGHRDFPGVAKACPSFDVEDWLRDRGIA